jgi:NurA-like 5'-3' nuclease
VVLVNDYQKSLINELHEILLKIDKEGLKDDDFYNWLSSNYFFEDDLEEIIIKIKDAKNNVNIKKK